MGLLVGGLHLGVEDAADDAAEESKAKTKAILEKLPLKNLSTDSFGGDKLMELFSSDKWASLSEACLGCGTCTFVCPTCQCYDIRDYDTGHGIQRFRCWDSCMYSDFTKMSAGQPRPTQLERFRQRFMHKLVYFPDNNDGCFGCVGCGRCIAVCPKDAIHPTFQASVRLLNCKIAEYAKAVLDGRPSYCINIVRDVSPNCDCHPENDVPIVPAVGMFASAAPVALDLACAEAINRQPVLPNSAITDLKHEHDCDRFHAAHDNTHWQDLIEHGKKLGIGQDTYELVTIR